MIKRPALPKADPRNWYDTLSVDRWWGGDHRRRLLILLLTQLQRVPYAEVFRFVLDGVRVTVEITAFSMVVGLIFGLIAALGRLSSNRLLKGVATLYVEVVRGIPLLVQLLYINFVLVRYIRIGSFQLGDFPAAVFGFGFCYGAYMAEIYRAGIEAIPKGQMEAARSSGMTSFQAMRYVVLPQAFRRILPPMGNEFIALLKDSSLVSIIAVADLTRRGREYMARKPYTLEVWTMVALIYLLMTLIASRGVKYLERRMSPNA